MFNKNKFAEILKDIRDSYGSINKMAIKTGVTTSYISKLIRSLYSNPPSPEILKKLADNSNNIVDYNTLMRICGYLDKNMEDKMTAHNNEYDKIEQLVREKIYNLEQENADLKQKLALANAKLEVYERVANVSNRETSIGFGPPIRNEGGSD